MAVTRSPQTTIHTTADQVMAGKALRDKTPRKAHAAWHPPAGRADPVDLLIQNSQGRLPELVPIRFGRMMANPFAFYRGAAAVMAYDLAHTASSGLKVQACGDCHLLNFGGFATAERRVLFDINDFDETSAAPWEWDVKRLVASFVIAGRSNGFSEADCRTAAWNAAKSYRERMALSAKMPIMQVWYSAVDLDRAISSAPDSGLRRFYERKLAKAREQSAHEKEFARLAVLEGSTPRIIDQPPLIFHPFDIQHREFRRIVDNTLARYYRTVGPHQHALLRHFTLADYAFKAVGVGSVGMYCFVVLLVSANGDPLFLQIKQAGPSVLEPYAGGPSYKHNGQRVVVGQRVMQAAGDPFLGWTTGAAGGQRHFYIRQLSDAKIKPVVEVMKAADLVDYARLCGWVLALAHARTGDVAMLSGYLGKSTAFEDALADFAAAYADQNERDHAALLEAVRAGRIEARAEI